MLKYQVLLCLVSDGDVGLDNMGLSTPYVGKAPDQDFQDFQEISKT